jgi:hypothetical protein
MISKLKIMGLLGITTTVGLGYAYEKIQRINLELGDEFIDFTVKSIKN